MRFLTILFFGLIFNLSLHTSKAAYAYSEDNAPDRYVETSIIADQTSVQGDETITLGIVYDIYPKWHIYWQNPGDSGTPPEVKWDAPEGFKFSALKHPIPKIIPYGPLTNYGHEDQTILIQELTLPEKLPEGKITLTANIDLLVCHEICIPESSTAQITLNGDQLARTDLIESAKDKLSTLQNYDTSFEVIEDNIVIKIIAEDTAQFGDLSKVNLLPIEWGVIDNVASTKAEAINSGLMLTHKKADRDLNEVSEFPFVVAYTNEDGSRAGIELSAAIDGSNAMAAAPAADINFLQAMILAILGGLILNLMPCVFPVLSMKALSLIQLSDKEEKKARAYGLSYTAGILLSFGLIAGVLIALKSGGAQIGWGFQLQNASVIIILTYLVFLIGLNLSGFFEFSGRFSHWGQKLTTKSGHGGAFWTGVLATLVATPCTAPFMGGAIGFALTQNAFVSLMVFLGLGFGLALPYLLLCYIPALRHKLPKPGAWMESFRQFLSFPMFITAAGLLWVLMQQASNNAVFFAILGMISITFILWMMKRKPQNLFLKAAHSLLMVIAVIGLIYPLLTGAGEMKDYEGFSPAVLEDALESNDPVFVNMTAAWCITCKVNERVALNTDKTQALFKEKNIRYIKGDWTTKNSEITQYLEQFNRQGVPLYVFYAAPDKATGKRPEPVLLPQILTNSIVHETISP